MRRRSFLGLACAAGSAIVAGEKVDAAGRGHPGKPLLFFVAGTRFQKPIVNLQAGEQVTFVADLFEGSVRYTVFVHESGIGYVPKNLVPLFPNNVTLRGQLLTIDSHALPWKKYLVAAWQV
jgi:hypothetical protein